MDRRVLGRTQQMVSILGLGGGRIGLTAPSREDAIAIIHRGLELGINYIDTASSYGQGESESRIGEAIRGRRDEVFIAAKVDTRTKSQAQQEIRDSVARLQVETVDLLQLHGVNDDATLDQVLAPDGALAAILDAQKGGIVRFVGITGHYSPRVLRRALGSFDFDTVLMPVGCLDHVLHPFTTEVLPLARERNMGIIGMKAIGHGVLDSHVSLPVAVRFALGQPVAVTLIGMNSLTQLEQNAAAASPLVRLSAEEEERLLDLVHPLAKAENLWWRRGAQG
jgi:aryl-alcohol dehydrogenase-like predicted oxidoreductase